MTQVPMTRGPGPPAAGPPGPVGYVSKTDMVAALIRELIITGELAAGRPLRQRDLAGRFGVSQTPVREAMRRLESEGLVIGDTHRGFTVVVPDDGPVEENFQIRAALESLGASLAARKIDAAGVAGLRELNERMRPLADGDPRYAELNREFHFSLYEYSRSPLLMSLMRLMWASLHGGPQVRRTHAESARQHDAILDALAAADAGAAAARTYRHIMDARRTPAGAGPPGSGGTPRASTPPASTPRAGPPPASTPPAGTPPGSTPPAGTGRRDGAGDRDI